MQNGVLARAVKRPTDKGVKAKDEGLAGSIECLVHRSLDSRYQKSD